MKKALVFIFAAIALLCLFKPLLAEESGSTNKYSSIVSICPPIAIWGVRMGYELGLMTNVSLSIRGKLKQANENPGWIYASYGGEGALRLYSKEGMEGFYAGVNLGGGTAKGEYTDGAGETGSAFPNTVCGGIELGVQSVWEGHIALDAGMAVQYVNGILKTTINKVDYSVLRNGLEMEFRFAIGSAF